MPEWAAKYLASCIFFPQVGFLTAVMIDPETGRGAYEGEGTEGGAWEMSFVGETAVYYKNRHMREMDNYYGDIHSSICGKYNVHCSLDLKLALT